MKILIVLRDSPDRGILVRLRSKTLQNKVRSLVDNADDNGNSSSKKQRRPGPPPLAPPPPPRWAKAALVSLSSLPLAISELALIAALSAVGTVIEQNKGIEYYQAAYPVGASGLGGLLDFRVITFLGWDHIYSSLPFLGLCALLAASLAACTSTRPRPPPSTKCLSTMLKITWGCSRWRNIFKRWACPHPMGKNAGIQARFGTF